MREAAAHRDAVRVVMRELFERLAAARGLVPPAGVLVVDGDVPDDLLASVRQRVAGFEGNEVELLGHAYESLLEAEDRKNAGAHYTPRVLADEVVEHALTPLVEGLGPAQVLDLRILDIATGSGIFLLSAAEYLSGLPGGPSLREVITTCLYGADVNETTVEICTLSLWLLAADQDLPLDFLDTKVIAGDSLLDESVAGRPAVDWNLLAPDVMSAGGFDAVIGNPPFLGVKSIRGAVGREVRDRYAETLLDGESGRSDLVVFFLARATALSRDIVALVLPDAISEGDSARFGPGRAIAQGYGVYRAETSRPWPSAAGVRIALLWLRRSDRARGSAVLDGAVVDRIGPSLGRAASTGRGRTAAPDWLPHGHQATIVLGRSLVLTHAEAEDLRAADPRIVPWIKAYLSGEDLVSRYGSASSRAVLDLDGIDLADLEAVPAFADRLALIRAEREGQFEKYPQLAPRWWVFLNPVTRLYDALADQREAIALSKHAKYIWPVIVPTGPVFSNGTIVYPSADRGLYAFLASTPHRLWAVDEGGSRLNESHRYNPSRLRATYPFPDSVDLARDAGTQLAAAVVRAQEARQVGVTELLNQVHGSVPVAPEIAALRDAIVEVDRAVLAAHGINEVLVHGLQVVGDRTRFGLDPSAEAAIKAQLIQP